MRWSRGAGRRAWRSGRERRRLLVMPASSGGRVRSRTIGRSVPAPPPTGSARRHSMADASARTAAQGFADAAAQRRANRATVEKYLEHTKGRKRLRRHELFAEEGSGGLWTNDTGAPIEITGRARLAEHAVWSLKCFPDWEWYNIQVFETQDPRFFWVECDGHGKINFPGYPEGVLREPLPPLVPLRRPGADPAEPGVHEPVRATARARHPGADGAAGRHPHLTSRPLPTPWTRRAPPRRLRPYRRRRARPPPRTPGAARAAQRTEGTAVRRPGPAAAGSSTARQKGTAPMPGIPPIASYPLSLRPTSCRPTRPTGAWTRTGQCCSSTTCSGTSWRRSPAPCARNSSATPGGYAPAARPAACPSPTPPNPAR